MKAAYRIVNAILAILIFVVGFFVDFIYVEISTGDSLQEIISSVSDETYDGVALEESVSIKRFIDIERGDDYLSNIIKFDGDGFYWPEEFSALNARLIAFIAAFILTFAAAIFIFVWSCCSNKRMPVFIAALLGIAFTIVMIFTFRSMSKDIYYNNVNVTQYVISSIISSSAISSLVGALANSAVTLYLALGGMQNGIIIVYVCIIVWAAVFWLSDLGDKNVQKEKEAEKAAKKAKKAAKAEKKAQKKEAKAAAKA